MNEMLMASALRDEIRALLWKFESLTGQRVTGIRFERYADGNKLWAGEVKDVFVAYRDRSGRDRTSP